MTAAQNWKSGDRVRVYAAPGIGMIPEQGERGTVELQMDDGAVLVSLDSGRRALVAPWELKSDA
jgi:hypothetical protein